MGALDVAERGIELAIQELRNRGASVERTNEGRSRNLLNVVGSIERQTTVYVKTRRTGTWHSTVGRGSLRTKPLDERRFWMFVDLTSDPPKFFVAPESWVETNIYETHNAFLERHGGQRPRNPRSTHHGIGTDRITEWQDRWDLLGL